MLCTRKISMQNNLVNLWSKRILYHVLFTTSWKLSLILTLGWWRHYSRNYGKKYVLAHCKNRPPSIQKQITCPDSHWNGQYGNCQLTSCIWKLRWLCTGAFPRERRREKQLGWLIELPMKVTTMICSLLWRHWSRDQSTQKIQITLKLL